MKKGLLIFVKNAEEGKVKTRLAETLGNKEALEIYRKLLSITAHNIVDVAAEKIVFYSESIEQNDMWSKFLYQKQIQQGNDLGKRMLNAFDSAFEFGYEKLVIIGSDCPDLDSDLINKAFRKLEDVDVVIGPASDGGYYLLALKSPQHVLFQDISWSTNKVLTQTLKACENLRLRTFLLPVLSDIDFEEDLINNAGFYNAITLRSY